MRHDKAGFMMYSTHVDMQAAKSKAQIINVRKLNYVVM